MSSPNTTSGSSSQSTAQEINLGHLLAELLDHYKLIVGITLLFTLIALGYALSATPVYQANALIQIEQKQANSLLSNLSQILPDSQPQSAPEITLLQSRMILGKTVDDLGLQTQVKQHYFPVVGKLIAKLTGAKPGKIAIAELELPMGSDENALATLTVINAQQYQLSGEGFEVEGRTGERLQKQGVSLLIDKIDAAPGTTFTVTMTTRLKAISALQESFVVADKGRDSGMLGLTLTGEDPELISTILDSIADNYLAQNIARQAAQDAKSLEFLNQQLPQVRSALDSAEDKLNAYRQQKDSVDLNLEAKAVLDQIVNADNQLNELTFKEAEISQLYKKDHPAYRALREKRDTLIKEKEKLNSRVSAMPGTQQEVVRLSRDVDSGRAIYLQLLSRQQELGVAKSSAIGNVRIIDDAITLIKPIKPKKALIMLVGMLAGGILSAGLVLLKVTLHQGLESPDQLEEKGIPVYACVPHSDWLKKQARGKKASDLLLAIHNPADPAIEALRGLRASLHFTLMDAGNNVLMISGASPGAGKSFISANLAVVMAQSQKKVLLIDADMRRGYVHQLFGLEEGCGVAEILTGQKTFDQVVVPMPAVGLDILPRGALPANPAELLMRPELKALLKSVSSHYDLVIIDTPPVLAVADALVAGRYADTLLMVARFEENTAREVMACVHRFEQGGIRVKGWILNDIKKRASSYYAYGYSPYPPAYGQNTESSRR